MKRLLPPTRKQIVRAIHIAALAYLLATSGHAQTATGDGNGNVTVSGTGSTSFVFGTTSVPPLASGGTLTITAGTNDSVSTGSNSNIYAIQVQVPATITNSGSLMAYNSNNFGIGGPATTLDITPTTTAGNVTVQNTGTGTITAATYQGNGTAIDVENVQQGSISVTNSGTVLVQGVTNSQPNSLTGIYANDSYATGSLTLNNSGTISTGLGSTASAYGANLTSSGSGTMTVTNSGTITVSAYEGEGSYVAALNLNSTGSGSIMVTNSNTVSASGYVISAAAGINANASLTGNISIMNSAAVTGTNTAGHGGFGIDATNTGTGSVYIQNSAAVTGSSSGGTGYSIDATSGTGLLTISNSGALTASGYTTSGVAANGTGDVSVTNTSSGTIQSTGNSSTGINATSTSGNAGINNAAAITVSGMYSSTAIQISGTTATLTNSGTLSSQGRDNNVTLGINATSTAGTLMVNNSGAITASGNYVPATDIQLQGTGNTTLITTGTQVLTATAHYNGNVDAYGESVTSSAGTVTIDNQQTLQINADRGHGIQGTSQLGTSVTNSGSDSVSGTYLSYGVQATAATGNVSATNSGYIMSTSSSNYGPAYGISGSVTTSGNVSLTNAGQVVVSSGTMAYGLNADSSAGTGSVSVNNANGATISATSTGSAAYGIKGLSNTGSLEIDNAGATSGTNTNGGLGYGIYATSNGPIVVNNTGTSTGSTSGIYLASAGTVNNYGMASGVTSSIQVPTASTVNLIGSSSVQGLIIGGADASSTSDLNFRLTIRTNYAAAKASLDAAIAQYDAAYASAAGVGNVESSVIVLNGTDYQFENFLGAFDELVQGRLYESYAGYGGIGGAIDNFDATSLNGSTILNALANVPDSSVPDALAQLSPQALQVFRNIAFDNTTFLTGNINNHLANLRDGVTGFDTSGFSVNEPGVDQMLTGIQSHLLAWSPPQDDRTVLSDSEEARFGGVDTKDAQPEMAAQNPDRWSAFISGSVILANLDNTTSNVGDSNYTTGSVLAGVDYRLDEHFTVGTLFDYSHTSVDLDNNGSKATVDSYSPGLYASYVDGGWYANGEAAYGFNNDTEDRRISIPGLQGDNHGASSGGQETASLTGGYEFHLGNWKIGPVATAQYVHLNTGGFQEQGPTALNIQSQQDDSLRSLAGLEARYTSTLTTPVGRMSLTPHLQASWQHEYLNNGDGITASFNNTGGGSFVVQGQKPERDSAFIDAGLDAEVAKNVTVFVDYQAQAGQDNFFGQSAQGGVRIGF